MARTRPYRASKKVTPLTRISANRASVPKSVARSPPVAADIPSSTTINGHRASLRKRTASAKAKEEIRNAVRLRLNPPKRMDKGSGLGQPRTNTVKVEGKKRPALRLIVNSEKVKEERKLLVPKSSDSPKAAEGETSNSPTGLENVCSSSDLSGKEIKKEPEEHATGHSPVRAGENSSFRVDHFSSYRYQASNTGEQARPGPVTVERRWMSSGVERVRGDPVPIFGISNLRHTVIPQRQRSLSPSPPPSRTQTIDKSLQSYLDRMPVPDVSDVVAGLREKGLGDASKRQKERARKNWVKRGREEFETFCEGLPDTWPEDVEME